VAPPADLGAPAEAAPETGRETAPAAPAAEADPSQLPPPHWIGDGRAFARLVERLAAAPEVALDTEADSFFTYREQLCLVQVSAAGEDYLIDPLAGFDLSGLGRLLADPKKRKVLHDGEFDVLLFKRQRGFEVRNLFDTSIASLALGAETVGLAAVLEREFGIRLDKSQQRSNWGQRPLTLEQVRYARLDTRYLLRLREILEQRLVESGRDVIHHGECLRLEQLEASPKPFDPDEFVKLKGARTLDLAQQAVLKRLFRWREEQAERKNLPPFKVLPHPVLVDLAAALPASFEELLRVPGFSPKLAERHGQRILEEVILARREGPLEKSPFLPARDGTDGLDEAGLELFDRLKQKRTQLGEKAGFDSSLVLNRHVLPRLVKERPKTLEALAALPGVQPWQVERFGADFLELIRRFEQDLASGKIDLRPRRRRPR
jgi:ribonuclease D